MALSRFEEEELNEASSTNSKRGSQIMWGGIKTFKIKEVVSKLNGGGKTHPPKGKGEQYFRFFEKKGNKCDLFRGKGKKRKSIRCV